MEEVFYRKYWFFYGLKDSAFHLNCSDRNIYELHSACLNFMYYTAKQNIYFIRFLSALACGLPVVVYNLSLKYFSVGKAKTSSVATLQVKSCPTFSCMVSGERVTLHPLVLMIVT